MSDDAFAQQLVAAVTVLHSPIGTHAPAEVAAANGWLVALAADAGGFAPALCEAVLVAQCAPPHGATGPHAPVFTSPAATPAAPRLPEAACAIAAGIVCEARGRVTQKDLASEPLHTKT